MLDAAEAGEEFAINDVIYAEISIGYDDPADLDTMMSVWRLRMVPTPRSALFGAGKAWRQYRSNGGIRTGVLPDFFIGAHALAEGWPLLTRDTSRIKTYFPSVALIAP